MEKMVVVVFDTEPQASDGMLALKQLDKEGAISIHAGQVIKKNRNGTVELLERKDEFPIGTTGGTAIGSLIGLLGGPIGVSTGAMFGALFGSFRDFYRSGVSDIFAEDVSSKLTPGKFAVVADISEEYVTPLDTKMANLGGQVIRTAKRHVEVDQMKDNIAALDAEIALLNKEMKNATREQKTKLQAKIDKLKEKRQKQIEHAKERSEQMKKEHGTKVQALKAKAANARGEAKAAIEARVTQINKDFEKTLTKWKNLEAERLEKKASRLEEKAKKLRS